MRTAHPKTTLPLESSFRFLGRSAWNETGTERLFWHASSGFEIAFRGRHVAMTLSGKPYDLPAKTAIVGIWIDDLQSIEPSRTVVLDEEHKHIEFKGLSDGDHVLRLVKRSEAIDSLVALQELVTDGSWLEAPRAKQIQIEVLGASNSCGYGILGRLGEPKTTANSTVFLTYAFQAARRLDADVSIVGASGWGVTRGYNTEGKPVPDKTLPYAYDYVGIDPDGTVVKSLPWNHRLRNHQAVVLNMGSNDFNAGNYLAMSAEDKDATKHLFQENYLSFLQHLRQVHPNAWIVCTYGMTGEADGFQALFESLTERANRTLGRVVLLRLNAAGTHGHPFGSDYHPNAETHLENAIRLADCLKALL